MTRYKVTRQHTGDREYLPGDEREANPQVVAHLVAAGVLEEIKAEKPVEKKAAAKK
ncbi:hypothetical protein Shpa_7 [Paracoccus phage Shpa]|uniref:Uncharacterized protein n=1 Tax=Paracoccus phage Shpa TaxID=1647282 RepID=A0A0U2BXC8_9CAUD|nr:hypothetical protein FDG85_gp07 [Paracoccus phage Shpa]AKG94518.1 hypothetical protein Shpa_7 [Paracoccus phage Shpa]